MEIAGLRFASNRLHFGSRAFWRENMEHLVEADRGWRYTMGEQVPESFIMSQLLGLLLPSAKTTTAGWCSWQIRCRLFEARPFFFSLSFCWCFAEETWAGAYWWLCCVCMKGLSRMQCQYENQQRHCDTGNLSLNVSFLPLRGDFMCFSWSFEVVQGNHWNMCVRAMWFCRASINLAKVAQSTPNIS